MKSLRRLAVFWGSVLLAAWLPIAGAEPLPDLAVTALDHQPDGVRTGQVTHFRATVRNEGSVESPPSALVLRVTGEAVAVSAPVPALAPGASVEIDVPAVLERPGPYMAIAILDPDNTIRERREDNNRLRHRGTSVLGGADLIILGLALTPDCHVVVKASNIGGDPLPDDAWDREQRNVPGISLFLEGRPAGWTPLRDIDPERRLQSPRGEVEWTSPLQVVGQAQVRAAIDEGNLIPEEGESNNDLARILVCPEDGSAGRDKVRSPVPLIR